MPASAFTLRLLADVQAAAAALATAQAALAEHIEGEAAFPACVSLKEAAFRWRVTYEAAAKRCQRSPDLFLKAPDGRWLVPIERL